MQGTQTSRLVWLDARMNILVRRFLKIALIQTAAGIDITTNKNLFVAATTSGTISYDIIAAGLDGA